ncbi:hypothetical protein [Kitasatospora cheerisanensis]|uniref:Uncharacterized protein n=1 Tax=Kitasatospora cheerisanensis KCTC 2395 TaxID=1348663 RepID=A0A066YGN8_9ACTN|nr:hypothetical protein [Kitasatospora cheerisanensis]KDN80648.1 hypothetical protein KCH_75660 [Kitasatospora cheerisanensis KCTC 2395]
MSTLAAGTGAGLDPVLADRVTEALLLAGLPVAHGGHGPGVRLAPDPAAGAVVLHWLASPRLEDAATAGGENPAAATRQLVADAVENALAEFLPALGLDAELTTVRAAAGLPAAAPPVPYSALPPVDPAVRAELVTAVRRSAALAGLPLATRPGAAGITLTACTPTGLPDLGWNPSPRLPAALRPAVRDAVRHALGVALAATGLHLTWHRPPGIEPQLRAHGPSAA